MKKKNKFLRVLSLLIFSVGVLIGMAVAGGTLLADIEASVFDAAIRAQSTLRLTCPKAITKDEIGEISATIKNPEEKEKIFYVRAHISEGYVSLKREINQQIPIAPGEMGKLSWEVYPEDAAYNRIILFRAYVSPSYPLPSQGNFCGVLLLDVPFFTTGTQFFMFLLIQSLACILGGGLIWYKINHPMDDDMRRLTNSMIALVVLTYGAILSSYLGLWILNIVLFAASILMIGVIFVSYYTARLKKF